MTDAFAQVRAEVERDKPWLYAEGESWWLVTGVVDDHHTFQDCFARVVPAWITGVDEGAAAALFEVLPWGSSYHVSAHQITRAKRLMFVSGDNPHEAYYQDDQDVINRFIRDAETTGDDRG